MLQRETTKINYVFSTHIFFETATHLDWKKEASSLQRMFLFIKREDLLLCLEKYSVGFFIEV